MQFIPESNEISFMINCNDLDINIAKNAQTFTVKTTFYLKNYYQLLEN